MPWSARFVDPIILPGGRKLLTLRDAATFIPVAIINNGDRWWFGYVPNSSQLRFAECPLGRFNTLWPASPPPLSQHPILEWVAFPLSLSKPS